ncbi:DsbA family protein [Patescibacteria group bacterium]|nr:DsbA family protein [Patescibacteria group bacterium]
MDSQNHTNKQGSSIWESNPRVMFALGIVAGVAIVSTIGLVLVFNFLMSGRSFNAQAMAGQTANPTAAPTQAQPTTDPTAAAPSLPPAAVDETRDHVYGPADAKVTIIEYSDFECPYCLRHYTTLQQIKKDFPNDVRVVFRHYPLSFHPEAQKAAEASECAADQGKFWEMYDKIFAANEAGNMGVDVWKAAAKELGLNTDEFNKCLDGGSKASRVAEDLSEGQNIGVEGTPASFVNGELISGAIPYETFKGIIQQAGATN